MSTANEPSAGPGVFRPRELASRLADVVGDQLPRWMTQACRDPDDPAHGCFDRNWWHYRIRDFASVILQQGGYAVHLAARLRPDVVAPAAADELARAACRFWNARALRHGAFEEYYPWEQGYPPLAFGTLAVAKLAHAGVVPAADVLPGLRTAARQLSRRFEPQAANQQVAGLAALAWVRKVRPDLVSAETLERVVRKTLALQTDEGWFWEYDGPDTGYLSVAMDCLWDAWDATGDVRFRASVGRALRFLHGCVAAAGGGIGMLNARNTDYVVPYGIARCLREGDGEERAAAAATLALLYGGMDSPGHFLRAVDDRYWCHYIGHSVVRAALLLRDAPDTEGGEPAAQAEGDRDFPQCGYVFRRLPGGWRLAVAKRKGGTMLVRAPGGAWAADYGWQVRDGRKRHVTHWWSTHWNSAVGKDGALEIAGTLVPCKPLASTPWTHAALRAASLVLGRAVIGWLKRAMIFRKPCGPYAFRRRITFGADGVTAQDEIAGLGPGAAVVRAPRASKRHVASADSFHAEDLALERGIRFHGDETRTGSIFRATSRWSAEP